MSRALASAPRLPRRRYPNFAAPRRSRWRRRSTPASARKVGGERWRISPARPPIDNPSRSQPPLEQRPVAAGARPAPGGQPPRGQIGIAFLTRQGFEIVGQQFVDGGGANDQAIKETIHAIFLVGLRPRQLSHELQMNGCVYQNFIRRLTPLTFRWNNGHLSPAKRPSRARPRMSF